MPESYLVTGCAGFIGSRVCQFLLDDGHDVIGVDNLDSAYDRRLKDRRLAELSNQARFEFQEKDAADRAAVEYVFADQSTAAAQGVRSPLAAWVLELEEGLRALVTGQN